MEIKRASAMPCKVTTPAEPNGSSWRRFSVSEWSNKWLGRMSSFSSAPNETSLFLDTIQCAVVQRRFRTPQDLIQVDQMHCVNSVKSRSGTTVRDVTERCQNCWKRVEQDGSSKFYSDDEVCCEAKTRNESSDLTWKHSDKALSRTQCRRKLDALRATRQH